MLALSEEKERKRFLSFIKNERPQCGSRIFSDGR